MKPVVVRLLLVLIVAALALGGCLDPVSILTDTRPTPATDGGRVRELPGPTTEPPTDRPNTSTDSIDTSDLIREPVTDADRTNEQLIGSTDIPIADLHDLALRFQGLPADTPRQNCTAEQSFNVGDQEQFSVMDQDSLETFTVDATLIAKNDMTYMWLDNNWLNTVNHNALQKSAQAFNDQIVPRNRALFGLEETPGIDCDPRLHIL